MDDKPPDDEEKPSVKGQEEQQLGEANRGQDHVPHFQGQQQMGRDNVGQVYPHAQYGNRTHQNDPSQAMDYPVNYPAHNSPMPQYSPQNRYPFYRSPPMYPQYPHPQAGMPQGLYQYPMYAPTVPRMHQPNAGQYPSYPNMPQPHPGQYPFPGGQAERFDQSFQKQHATSPGYPGTATTDVQSPGRVSEPNGPQQPMDCPGDQQSYDMPEHVHQVEEHENEATGHAQEQAMYDTGASESENSMSDESDDSEEAIGLLVEGLMKISEKSVRSYFGNRRKSGGGDISSLSLYEDRHSAVIYFKDAAAVDKIIQKAPHLVEKKQVQVSVYEPDKKKGKQTDESASDSEEGEEEPKTIEVRGFKPETSDDTFECYFENSRKGGGEITNFERNGDVIYITFANAETINTVMKKAPHTIGQKQLEVSIYKPDVRKAKKTDKSSFESVEEEEVEHKTIEVRGFKPKTSSDTLELYFENPRKGGGEISEFNRNDEDNVIYITFEDVEIAKKIVEKPHKVDGCSLQVKLYIPPKPRPTYNDRLLITGLKSTTTKDCLINYLEAKTGCEIDESSVVYGEEEGTALIHFSEMPDVEKLQQVCAKRTLEGSKLTVSKVPISNSIIVKGLKPKTSEDTVWFYFEGKRSGNVAGVEVEKVQMKPDEGYSLVYFKDHTVIDQILDYGKGHKLDGAELNVSIYHECLGVGGGVCDPTWFKMPDPLQVKNLDKHKLKFIREFETSREALIKQLKHCHSELTWVTGDDSAVELKCSLTTEVPDARRLSRTWKTDTETALKEFLSLLEVEKIKVLKDIWDEVEKEIDAKHTEGASMFLYKDQSSIVVVGYAKFGKKMAEEVNSLVKKVEDDFERKKQTVSENINKVKLIQLRLLLASGFPKDMMNKFPGLNVNIKIQKVEISFQGIVGDVKKAQVQMYESLQNTTYSKVQNFSQGQLQLSDKKSVRDHIVKKMKSKNLVGVWETTPTEVTILAFSDSDAVEVAQVIKKSVIENIHPLVPEAIILLSSDGWFKLATELSNRYGEMIKIITEPDNSQVVIIATDDIIAAAAEDVSNFFSENTIFEQTVKFPAGIQRFLQQHCDNNISKIASNLRSMQVQIGYSRMSKEFTIKATKYGMDSSIKALQDLANKVDQKSFVHKRPGIRKLLLSQKGTQFVATLESNNKCIIEKTFDSSEKMTIGSQHVMESTAAAVEGVNVVAKCSMPGQRQLCFVAGDITRMKVDVIVNAANERLDHIGGLARAIVDKGGDSIQRECSNYVSRHGRVPVGAVAISQPGNLPCKLIVHAVGPVWSGGRKGEEDLLRDAIINSLQETDKKNFTSIAIPALSCGIYNYPVPEATNEIVEAIKEYFKDFPASSVRVIYLTDTSINTVNFFIEAGKQVFGNRNMHMEDKSSLTSYGGTFGGSHVKPSTAPKSSQSRRRSNAARSSTTSSGVNIYLVKGEIAREQADIIVNSTSNNLDLKNGAVSKSILTAAGDSLQKECRRNYSKGIQPGEIAVTSGGNLNCKKVFHTCLPNWSNDPTGKQLLSNLIFDCMKEASKAKCRSIAFPAMGTGNLGYPRDIVAKCMHDSINEFGNQNRNSSLRDVKIVVYDKDHATVKAFESELSKSSGPSSGKIDRKSRKFDGTSMDTEDSRQNEAGWHQVSQSDLSEGFKIGSVSLSVKQGDITKEKVDCIVNSTNDRLDFSQGGVSQAIARACGQRLKDECVKKVKKMAKNGVVSTGAEGLGCNAIVHVNISHFNDNWEKIISKCLSAAEDVPDVKSIAFPALGTGMAASSADNVAESFVTAINNHQKSNPSICDVRIIIFQPDMLQSFTDTIQKALGQKAGKPGFWHTVTDTVKGFIGYGSKHEETSRPSASDDSSEVPLYYFSDDYTSIDGCIQAVESYCRDETIKKVIADQALEHLNQSQIKKVYSLSEEFQVSVTFEQNLGRITIEGIQQDVYNALEVAQKLLREVDRLELEHEKAQILSNMVQWHFVEIDDQGQEQQTPYDKEINGVIEKAYCDKLPNVTLPAGRSAYIIDFGAMEEYPADNKEDTVKVVRKDLLKESLSAFESPSNWAAMGQDEDLKVVTLQTIDPDYQTVSQSFMASVQYPNAQIIKIERIQNKTLYQQYVAKKKQISRQSSNQAERKLWHGTSADAISSVNTHGFNRSYCGKNATVHGDGVYFAVNASYSAHNTYSRPDAQGHKHLYYASVLTGDFTQGQRGMRVPPVKSTNQSQLYDSVVDNVNGPGMYIIFNDTQAYPDYLITFTI